MSRPISARMLGFAGSDGDGLDLDPCRRDRRCSGSRRSTSRTSWRLTLRKAPSRCRAGELGPYRPGANGSIPVRSDGSPSGSAPVSMSARSLARRHRASPGDQGLLRRHGRSRAPGPTTGPSNPIGTRITGIRAVTFGHVVDGFRGGDLLHEERDDPELLAYPAARASSRVAKKPTISSPLIRTWSASCSRSSHPGRWAS